MGQDGINWIHLAQDKNKRKAVVNIVINIQVHKIRGICWLAEELVGFQAGLYSMKFST
jgi:hypothetical protein